jgi:hypothetical protein
MTNKIKSIFCCLLFLATYIHPVSGSGISPTVTIIPERVGLYLSQSREDNELPDLTFAVFAGGGCDQVSDLQFTMEFQQSQPNIFTKGGHTDILSVQIDGYRLNRQQDKSITCPAVIAEARGSIELSKYQKGPRLQLKVILKGKANYFDLNLYEGILYLNPLDGEGVISFDPRDNMPPKPQFLGFMTKEFTDRLARVRVEGAYAQNSDLGISLLDHIRVLKYEPLDEKISGYPKTDPLDDLLVYVPGPEKIPDKFKIIGQVKYREVIAGEKTIDVGIEKAVIYPFFVRKYR